jgi:Fic-DOC domain mobile mystery protein B
MALIGKNVPGETPLSDQDLQGLKLPLLTTRGQLSAVEGPNIVSGKQWALGARRSQLPGMLSIEYLQELHRRMFRDVWQWAGEIRPTQLENAFASSVPDIRPHLAGLYAHAVEFWLVDPKMGPDEFAVRVHHRVVKIHPFRNGNGRHSRLLADLIMEKHYQVKPFTWGGGGDLGNSDPNRQQYLECLRAADRGEYDPLLKLCRAK